MKEIGSLPDEPQARTFEDHLLSLGIRAMVEESGPRWVVWVYKLEDLETARAELGTFAASPNDPRYARAGSAAQAVRAQEAKRQKALQRNAVDTRRRWRSPASSCPVTMALIGISIAVAVFSSFGSNEKVQNTLFILPNVEASYDHFYEPTWPARIARAAQLVVENGEYWRLFSSMFLHFGVFHIVFNMMWLHQLGMAIEFRRGSLKFLSMVVLIEVFSSFSQLVDSGPASGGMSGVVYGLFGYIWMKGKFDPTDDLHMPRNTVYWLMGWFFLCMTPILGIPIANTAHAAGLAAGLAMGIGSAKLRQMR